MYRYELEHKEKIENKCDKIALLYPDTLGKIGFCIHIYMFDAFLNFFPINTHEFQYEIRV